MTSHLIKLLVITISAIILDGCVKESKKTVIYGTVMDKNRQTVDSVPISIYTSSKRKFYKDTCIAITYSNKSGNYRVILQSEEYDNEIWVMIDNTRKHSIKYENKLYLGYTESNQLIYIVSAGKENKCNFRIVSEREHK